MNKLVFLTSDNPFSKNSGAKIRDYSILKLLCEEFSVHLIYFEGNDGPKISLGNNFHSIHIEREACPIWKKVSYLFRPYILNGYIYNIENELKKSYETGAVLWISRLALAQYIPFAKKLGYKIILDEHNIESTLIADLSHSFLKKILNFSLRMQLTYYERKFCQLADLVIVTSTMDAEKLFRLSGCKGIQISNLIETELYASTATAMKENNKLLFVGTLDYEPNRSGLIWFIDHIFPKICSLLKSHNWLVHIVGARPTQDLKIATAHFKIKLLADVDSVLPHLQDASIVFVPLLSGGGTRLKIIEALAAGKAIVSTVKGAEGIDGLLHRKNIWLAENATEFAEGIEKLISDPDLRRELGRNAQNLALSQFDWKSARPKIRAIVETLNG